MAKVAFWITAGPALADKALSNLVLAGRLKANRGQDVQVYFLGPGLNSPDGPTARCSKPSKP